MVRLAASLYPGNWRGHLALVSGVPGREGQSLRPGCELQRPEPALHNGPSWQDIEELMTDNLNDPLAWLSVRSILASETTAPDAEPDAPRSQNDENATDNVSDRLAWLRGNETGPDQAGRSPTVGAPSPRGRLRHGNPSGDPGTAPRCEARARTRGYKPCRAPAMRGKLRCRMHRGASTGPTTAAGLERMRQSRLKHGRSSHATLAEGAPAAQRAEWDRAAEVQRAARSREADERVVRACKRI